MGGLGDTIFLRGDVGADGVIDISDGIAFLRFLFSGGTAPTCVDAADADDSGRLELTDGVHILRALFLGDRVLPPPGRAVCGSDPTVDSLDCAAFAPCNR